MAKLTTEQKIEIYQKNKSGKPASLLSKQYNVRRESILYLIKLIDTHGESILRKENNKYYSPELKIEMINKILIDNQSIRSTAIEYGLPSCWMLVNWIRSYKENKYVIVEKKRGRSSTMNIKNKNNKKYEDMTPEEKVKYLEEKNQYLEAENEYLKKLRAVVQARKNQQQKKK